MDKLLAADNLAIVALAAWIITLKLEAAALRKENAANWRVVARMGKFVKRMYEQLGARFDPDNTGTFYGDATED